MRSLRKQTVKSDVYLVTSTPSAYIDKLAETYRIPVFVREGASSLKEDWLFGWRLASADHSLVTIAHQDDKYNPHYTEELLKAYEQYPDMTVFCSDYVVMKTEEGLLSDGKVYPGTTRTVCFDLVRLVKKVLRIPLRLRSLADQTWVKKLPLMFGNSICCPAVTYSRAAIEGFSFDRAYKFACDWDAWERLSRQKGAFLYIPHALCGHRIHEDSETTKQTEGEGRAREEYAMFCRFWPAWIARRLAHYYAKGADSNQL
jgi:hypothetical protein